MPSSDVSRYERASNMIGAREEYDRAGWVLLQLSLEFGQLEPTPEGVHRPAIPQ